MTEAIPVRKNERGLTLVETVVALAIVFIVFLGLTDAGLLVLDYNINNAARDEGVRVAESVMEQMRNRDFSELQSLVATPDPPTTETRSIRGLGIGYTWQPTVTTLNATNLQVEVNVAWNRSAWTPSGREQRAYTHRVVSIVSSR